jgi:metal-sulfur cluster biosynthetic enzyme
VKIPIVMPEQTTVMEAMRHVIDPELGIDVVELGMVGAIEIDGDAVLVHMRLTSMSCPFTELFVEQVRGAVCDLAGARNVSVRFDEPWSPDLMSDAARTELQKTGLFPLSMRQPKEGSPQHTQLLQLMTGVLSAPTHGA